MLTLRMHVSADSFVSTLQSYIANGKIRSWMVRQDSEFLAIMHKKYSCTCRFWHDEETGNIEIHLETGTPTDDSQALGSIIGVLTRHLKSMLKSIEIDYDP